MNQQEREPVENLNSEATDEHDFFQFADLELTDEQLAEVKGGPGWCTACAVVYGNHNETVGTDANAEQAEEELLLDDLLLEAETEQQVKGGPGGGFGCTWCSLQGNHNEATAEDDSEAGEDSFQFADLELADEQLAEVKGGPGGGITKLGSKRLTL